MSAVRAVHDRDFGDVVLGSAVPVVVGLWAGGTSACEAVGRVLEEVAVHADWVGVVRLDVEESPRTAAAYRVEVTPSVLVFSGGSLVLALPELPSALTILGMLRAAPRPITDARAP